MKRTSGSGRWWSIFAKVGFVAFVAAAAFDGTGGALAQDAATGGEPAAVAPDPDDVPPPTRAYFHQYPDGEGSIPFDSLSPADQEGIMQAAEIVDTKQGDAVHQAWSAYSQEMVATAAVKRAAYQSGTQNLEYVGVVP